MSNIGLKSTVLALSLFACTAGCSAAPDGDPALSLAHSPAQAEFYIPGYSTTHLSPALIGRALGEPCAAGPTTTAIQVGAETSNGYPVEIYGRACLGEMLDIATDSSPSGYAFQTGANVASDGTWEASFYSKDCGPVTFEISVPNSTTPEDDIALPITCS